MPNLAHHPADLHSPALSDAHFTREAQVLASLNTPTSPRSTAPARRRVGLNRLDMRTRSFPNGCNLAVAEIHSRKRSAEGFRQISNGYLKCLAG
jgi:hypothetical protein